MTQNIKQSHKITKYHSKSLAIPEKSHQNTHNHIPLHEILKLSKEIKQNHTKHGTITQNHKISLEITRNPAKSKQKHTKSHNPTRNPHKIERNHTKSHKTNNTTKSQNITRNHSKSIEDAMTSWPTLLDMHRCCWRQINLVVNGALFTFLTLPLFSHMMRTPRTSTVVLTALLAAVIEFCFVCLVCSLYCCSFCLFWVRLFSLCLPVCCGVFVVFPPFSMPSGEGGRYAVPFRCGPWSSLCSYL